MQPEKFTEYVSGVDETRKIFTRRGLEKSKFIAGNSIPAQLSNNKLIFSVSKNFKSKFCIKLCLIDIKPLKPQIHICKG